MRSTRRMAIPAVLAAVVLLSGFSCSKGTQNLATASDAIAHALVNAQAAAVDAEKAGVMTAADYAVFNQYLISAATAGQALDGAIRNNESAASVSVQVTNFLNAFNALQQTGLVGIKDQKTQLAISTIITGAEASLAVIQAQIGAK